MSFPTDAVTLPASRRYVLPGAVAGESMELWIAEPLPGVMPLPPGPRRVLWVLDANLFFGTVTETTRLMAQLFGELPPLLVVGVAHPTHDPALQAELRARDLTPSVDSGFESRVGGLPGPGPTLPEGDRLGGADRFADWLTDVARRAVAERHDVAVGGDILFGASLGGLFVIHTLLTRPGAFRTHLAVSPALWWDDGRLLRQAEEGWGPRPETEVFLAVGRGEEGPQLPFLAPWRMVSNVEAMADRLGRHSGLRVGHCVVDGESHTSVVQPGLTRGLRWATTTPGPTGAG